MTECPKCKGYGIVGSAVPDILRGRGAIFSSNECDMCHGSGEVQMTNEEWLRNLSFNELARVLYCMIINGERIRPDLAYIKRWLKEKHEE